MYSFRHSYLLQHTHHDGAGLTIHPGPLFAAVVCLIVLLAWAAFQMQARCRDCSAWPVRCRCSNEHGHRDDRR